jgi:hypothetical protein
MGGEMVVRNTSREVYEQIKREGLLSQRRWQVYDTLYNHGPLTGAQVAKLVKARYGKWCESETVRNRLTELREMEAIEELDEVACPTNGRRVILFDVTNRLPRKIVKKRRKREWWLVIQEDLFGGQTISAFPDEDAAYEFAGRHEVVHVRENTKN